MRIYVSLKVAIETCIIRLGDIVEIQGGNAQHLAGASDLAEMKHDDSQLIDFDPTSAIPALSDPNPGAYSLSWLNEITRNFIAEQLAAFAFGQGASRDPVIRAYRQHRAPYTVGLIFPDATARWYRFDFGGGGFSLSERNRFHPADIVHRIAASPWPDGSSGARASSMCAPIPGVMQPSTGSKRKVALCHEDAKASCCMRDEGLTFGAAV